MSIRRNAPLTPDEEAKILAHYNSSGWMTMRQATQIVLDERCKNHVEKLKEECLTQIEMAIHLNPTKRLDALSEVLIKLIGELK